MEALDRGEEVVYKESGNSMTPIIKHRQPVTAKKFNSYEVGDVVWCKVKGNYYTHKIFAKGKKGYLIGNNHGHMNGWTKKVFGKIIRVG
jgi:hypothetical protein